MNQFAPADLTPLNTLGLRSHAQAFLRIDRVAQLEALALGRAFMDGPVVVLGGGSNIVAPEEVHARVLQMAIHGRERVGETANHWLVRAGAGEVWHDFVRWTLEQGLPGLENLSLIPGTVGAAPIQNIGAYGLELASRFHSLVAVHLDGGEMRTFTAADCRFGYRDSVFKHADGLRWVIVSVTFALPRRWQAVTGYADVARELEGIAEPTPLQVSDAVVAIRRRKLPDPAQIGNAGSFFKNPVVAPAQHAALAASHPTLPAYPQADGTVKLAAGWLIEQAGWKGRSLGPVGMYERQALVLVNHGGATAQDVRALAQSVQADVLARFGVRLEPEPVFL
ncbi:MAG: UDP-N-acetylmuramate dehydrogenase [Moraxellaceae bacterium]|nr:UDP-N-acetylmuramate dehydrogenase [Moraxellaceae bacterium]